ncbi:BLOC-1 related complex subunit 6 isoform X1 [Lampris incognitus]|uniref:BLOC-1 related complex subunit 6 isoform X1 n=1 Tax=Lampris incognitus TaxID=2546036 RepID=UPI0024B48AD7|nr:BLOC-1 related complex subunit 6 isoform X1 [Lampris incognitus]XP_056129658.1 BLOC-1 related complex subunit 6 isoform X1 [Lampris incognitus]
MSLFPVIGTDVPESANGVLTSVSLEPCSENGPNTHTPGSLKFGGSRGPCHGQGSKDGSHRETENHIDMERAVYDGEGCLDTEAVHNSATSGLDSQTHLESLHAPRRLDPSLPTATCTGDTGPKDTQFSETSHSTDSPGTALPGDIAQHIESKDSPAPQGGPISSDRQWTGLESLEGEMDGEMEKQDEEEDEKKEREWDREHGAEGADMEPTRQYSSSAPGPRTTSSPPPSLPSDSSPCPPHVMAQVRVRNVPERDRIVRGMQDSKSLDEISQACGADCSGPIHRSRGSARRPADIPPIDPAVLLDLQRHTQDVAHSVEIMMRSLNGTIQNMTALSVGYIQTYRDSVDSLGESVDMSIKGMYTLMARCEELDRSMQPIHTLAAQIRDIKRTLDALEAICK